MVWGFGSTSSGSKVSPWQGEPSSWICLSCIPSVAWFCINHFHYILELFWEFLFPLECFSKFTGYHGYFEFQIVLCPIVIGTVSINVQSQLIIVSQMQFLFSKVPVVVSGKHSQAFSISSNISFTWGDCIGNLFLSVCQFLFYIVWTQAVLLVPMYHVQIILHEREI